MFVFLGYALRFYFLIFFFDFIHWFFVPASWYLRFCSLITFYIHVLKLCLSDLSLRFCLSVFLYHFLILTVLFTDYVYVRVSRFYFHNLSLRFRSPVFLYHFLIFTVFFTNCVSCSCSYIQLRVCSLILWFTVLIYILYCLNVNHNFVHDLYFKFVIHNSISWSYFMFFSSLI